MKLKAQVIKEFFTKSNFLAAKIAGGVATTLAVGGIAVGVAMSGGSEDAGEGNKTEQVENVKVEETSSKERYTVVKGEEESTTLKVTNIDKETTEQVTEPVTEQVTEPVTEAPTQAPTEAPTEPVTQPVTQPATQAPTEPATQPPTEAPTQAVAHASGKIVEDAQYLVEWVAANASTQRTLYHGTTKWDESMFINIPIDSCNWNGDDFKDKNPSDRKTAWQEKIAPYLVSEIVKMCEDTYYNNGTAEKLEEDLNAFVQETEYKLCTDEAFLQQYGYYDNTMKQYVSYKWLINKIEVFKYEVDGYGLKYGELSIGTDYIGINEEFAMKVRSDWKATETYCSNPRFDFARCFYNADTNKTTVIFAIGF